MYLFRALNASDYNDIKNGISASALFSCSTQSVLGNSMDCVQKDLLDSIAYHVKYASNQTQKDCWISTCKKFDVCVTEYALPQGGGYNTAVGRKNIAVIDLSYWWDNCNLKSEDCYTIFRFASGANIIFNQFPAPKRNKNKTMFEQVYEQVQQVKQYLNTHNDLSKALFDCSMYPFSINSSSFAAKRNPAIYELSLSSFAKNKNTAKRFELFDTADLSAVQNGIAHRSTEVLCFNTIPAVSIKAILTPIQQDVLYMVNRVFREEILKGLINKNLFVEWDEELNQAIITTRSNSKVIQGEAWMYPGMAFENLKINDPRNIELQYKNLMFKKEAFLKEVIEFIAENISGSSIEVKNIPEYEGLRVYDFDDEKYNDVHFDKEELYSIAAIKWKGTLYSLNGVNQIGIIGKENELIKDLIRHQKINHNSL